MRSILSLLLVALFYTGATAQDFIAEKAPSRNLFELAPVLSSAPKAKIESWDINDSLSYLPFYDDYCSWNTDRVHPYKFELTGMTDTVVIPLAVDTCSFKAPIIGRKTSDFGYRRYGHHYGVDIKLHTGDPVQSAFEGVVRVAHYDGDYGRVVVVRHNNGLETLYAHLSQLKVKEGDWVNAGDIVGLGGNTGRSTGSHLHFEARYLGEPIDPNEIIDWELGLLCRDTLYLNADHFEYLVDIRKRKYYRIRRGDTLSRIASRHGTSIRKLCSLNGIRSTTTLRIGRVLRWN
jgi:murein DD-endopeptidase MepM/ murein hydrolase activator NlpD